MGDPITLETLNQAVINAPIVPSAAAKPKAMPKRSEFPPPDSWVKVGEKTPTETPKRRTPKKSEGQISKSAMEPDLNSDRIQQLQAQIAVLQRELARETAVPSGTEEA